MTKKKKIGNGFVFQQIFLLIGTNTITYRFPPTRGAAFCCTFLVCTFLGCFCINKIIYWLVRWLNHNNYKNIKFTFVFVGGGGGGFLACLAAFFWSFAALEVYCTIKLKIHTEVDKTFFFIILMIDLRVNYSYSSRLFRKCNLYMYISTGTSIYHFNKIFECLKDDFIIPLPVRLDLIKIKTR